MSSTNGKCSESCIYALIGNIPFCYRSCDLRNFFSQFIETGGFDCFHFRHRPETKLLKTNDKLYETTVERCETESRCSSGSTGTGVVNDGLTLAVGDDHRQPASYSDVFDSDTANARAPLSHNDDQSGDCQKNQSPLRGSCTQQPSTTSQRGSSKSSYSNKTCCCIVRVRSTRFEELKNMYHKKHWLDKNYESIPGMLCFVERVKVASAGTGIQRYKTRGEVKNLNHNGEQITQADIDSLIELKPPKNVMPCGNVGTPTRTFLALIKSCKLPPSVISNLGLRFPKSRAKRMYGDVPYEYPGKTVRGVGSTDEDEVVLSASGHQLEHEGETVTCREREDENSEIDNDPVHEDSEEDADGCEEWERHEALNDDPANMERNKERLFEQEMEVTWEKGGPGIVWYTDAQFWAKEQGDFDEQTSDDWDVDMSAYYEPHAGDKDARDFLTIRRDTRRRRGIADVEDLPQGKRGKFELHTKGIGQKLLLKQGWEDGEGLGVSSKGIPDAIDPDGQNPKDKSGFGYRGEKLVRHDLAKPIRQWKYDKPIVTSVYDNFEESDPQDTLYRRLEPHHLKYRPAVKFTKSTLSSLHNELKPP